MTRPVFIGFLYDLPNGEPKIFFRSMLYATGKRGHIVEALYVNLRHRESQIFNFWMYGENKAQFIGSGLRVEEDGVSFNHYFLPPKHQAAFEFLSGNYALDVFAVSINRTKNSPLISIRLALSQEHSLALKDKTNGILFTWRPETQSYDIEISRAPVSSLPESLPAVNG